MFNYRTARMSVRRWTKRRRPSGYSETAGWIQAIFFLWEAILICHISRSFKFSICKLLALLDYVSRGYGIWDFARRPSVVCVAIISELSGCANFFQSSVLGCPGPYNHMIIEFLNTKTKQKPPTTFHFFPLSLMSLGTHGSKYFKNILVSQIAFDFFRTFPEFSSINGAHKSTV